MAYEIKKATEEMMGNKAHKMPFPLAELKIGEYFEIKKNQITSVYNAIKYGRNYTKQIEGYKFKIRKQSEDVYYVLRIN